jgi:nucleotide-binding universal stress UspA family protein
MLALSRILVPTDFSSCAERACGAALELAASTSARVHYVHAAGRGEPPPTEADVAGWQVPVQRLESDDTSRAIVDAATSHDADLIVMGTHGRRGFRRLIVGSVTEAVMRSAECPVLAVPCVPISGRRVLVPIDFSDASREALRVGREFAAAWDAPLDALYVIDSGMLHLPYGVESSEQAREDAVSAAAAELRRFCADEPGLPTPLAHVVVGAPAGAIADFAGQTGSRLIVMSLPSDHHSRAGSTAERVLRSVTCSVLALPPTPTLLARTTEASSMNLDAGA